MQALLALSNESWTRAGRHFLSAGIACMTLLVANCAFAASADDLATLLERADSIKGTNRAEFKEIIATVNGRSDSLSPQQQRYLNYLKGWQLGYEGSYDAALALLNSVSAESTDVTLQFRAYGTMVNVLAIAKRHEEAFTQLTRLIELLPQVTDRGAREQGMQNAMLLYNHVGQYDLSLSYADKLISEGVTGRSACIVGEMRLNALYKSKQIQIGNSDFQSALDVCKDSGDAVFANLIRTYIARLYFDQRRFTDSITILKEHYDEIQRTQYPPLISTVNAALAFSYRETGDTVLAKQFALRATESAVKDAYTEPLVNAYRLLYVLAKEQGDAKSALAYHEQYTAADKGYLDDVSAGQLAYQRVTHEAFANKMQIDTLNKQNEVLHLQRSLADKAVETSRLYIVMLGMGLAFVVFMAYRTKRSQMHFMNLSRLDGLTGLTNRPHFLELAETALKEARQSGQCICVIICDLDYFKRINDTCGHAAGDMALKKTAAVFQTYLRKQDIVGRLGGEEFGMMLINCDAAAAYQRCDEIRLAIAKITISNGTTEFQLAACLGIATTTSSGHELRQLLADADTALYDAKRGGRNCVVQYRADQSNEARTPSAVLEPASAGV